jgi:hypothetical protein
MEIAARVNGQFQKRAQPASRPGALPAPSRRHHKNGKVFDQRDLEDRIQLAPTAPAVDGRRPG